MVKLILSFLVVWLFVSCSNDNSNGVKREIIDGVEYIKNPEHGLWQNRKEAPIKFELIRTYGKENEPENEMFASIREVVSDDNENLYIFDNEKNDLTKFDNAGKFLWRKGKTGDGPGDFKNFNRMQIFKDFLIITSQWGNKIELFDLEGKYIKRLHTDKSLLDFKLSFIKKPDTLVFTNAPMGKVQEDFAFATFSDTIKSIKNFSLMVDDKIKLYKYNGMGVNFINNKDKISVSNYKKYKISQYDHNGKLIKIIERSFNKIIGPGIYFDNDRFGMQIYSVLGVFLAIDEKYSIISSSYPKERFDPDEKIKDSMINKKNDKIEYQNCIDLFNNKGELLYSLYGKDTNPEIGKIQHVDKNGNLYTITTEPFPQVRYYKVIINEK